MRSSVTTRTRAGQTLATLVTPPGLWLLAVSPRPTTPEDLARIVDCDLADRSFWDQGLALIERDIERGRPSLTCARTQA